MKLLITNKNYMSKQCRTLVSSSYWFQFCKGYYHHHYHDDHRRRHDVEIFCPQHSFKG